MSVAGSYPFVWQVKHAEGFPCLSHSSRKTGLLPAVPCAPFCHVICVSVWQLAQSGDVCGTAGAAEVWALAMMSVVPAARKANTRAINKRSIRDVIDLQSPWINFKFRGWRLDQDFACQTRFIQ